MATIPRSGGPRLMPGRVQAVQTTVQETGMAPARALENLGNVGMQYALDTQNDANREAARIADEQARQAEAAERARETAHLGKIRDTLTDAADEVAAGLSSGQIPKDQAEQVWTERAKQLTDEGMAGFRDTTRPLVQGEIETLGLRLGNGIRKAKAARDRDDVTAGLTQTLEYLQRQYKTDPAGTTAKAMQTIEALGPYSNLKPDALAKVAQGWREGTQYTAAFEIVNAAKDNPKALTAAERALAGEQFADLDPHRRAVLVNQIDGHRVRLAQQAEIAAARAARQQEAAMNRARAEFETFQAMADKGTVLAPEYIERVTKATAGTPYQAGIKAVAQQVAAVGGFAAQPIATQQATLDAINAQIAQQGRTPELEARRNQVEKVLKGSRSDVDADPLRAGLERGVITELQPLNLSAGVPGLVQQLSQRVQMANTVAQWSGKPVSPLLAAEATQVATMLQSLPPDSKATTIATLAATIGGRQAQALAAQIDKDDKALALAMAAGASMTTAGRPTSTLILKGQQAVKDKTVKLTPDNQKNIAKVVGEALSGKARDDVIQAATLIYAGLESEGSGNIERAVRLAVGGDIIEHNGTRIPISGGMTPRDFRDRLGATKPEALSAQAPDGVVMVGGQQIPLAQFLTALPDAQLQPAGLGRYYVRAGGAVVTNSQRRPITIEVR